MCKVSGQIPLFFFFFQALDSRVKDDDGKMKIVTYPVSVFGACMSGSLAQKKGFNLQFGHVLCCPVKISDIFNLLYVWYFVVLFMCLLLKIIHPSVGQGKSRLVV